MPYELDCDAAAETIRSEKPQELSLLPAPQPFVGEIRVLKRHNGGYLVAVLDYDDQAALLPDGSMAAQVVPPAAVASAEPEDALALALERAQEQLNELRLRSAFEIIARLREDRDEETLVDMLRDALESAA